jgi:hypothetical protein
MSTNYLARFVNASVYGDDFRYPLLTILTERFHKLTPQSKMALAANFAEALPQYCEWENDELWLNDAGLRVVMEKLHPIQPAAQMLVWLDELAYEGW